jgi:hypothetical protein
MWPHAKRGLSRGQWSPDPIRIEEMSAIYNDLQLTEGTYVLMQDVDRYDDTDYPTQGEAEAAMVYAVADGEEAMWVGRVEMINDKKRS